VETRRESELAEIMQTKTPPNILAKKLARNQRELKDAGVTYSFSRSGQKREISLLYVKRTL